MLTRKPHGNASNTRAFIAKARAVHGRRYDYSKVEYTVAAAKVEIVCKVHGSFWMSPGNHIRDHGCPKCNKGVSIDKSAFVANAVKIHGPKYDYSKVVYVNCKEKVEIVCPAHGSFMQAPISHISNKSGCPKCGADILRKLKTHNTEQFIQKSIAVHGNTYDYRRSLYVGAFDAIEIVCRHHGSFWQVANAHVTGSGCPKCCMSKGELAIAKHLEKSKIVFKSQFRTDECMDKRTLPFDFAVQVNNKVGLIEYQGDQHFVVSKFFGGKRGFNKIVRRDKIKADFCRKRKIPLLLIHPNHDVSSRIDNFIARLISRKTKTAITL